MQLFGRLDISGEIIASYLSAAKQGQLFSRFEDLLLLIATRNGLQD
jgi:hypothetical protein